MSNTKLKVSTEYQLGFGWKEKTMQIWHCNWNFLSSLSWTMHPLKGYHRLIDQEEGENKNNSVKRFGLGVTGERVSDSPSPYGF